MRSSDQSVVVRGTFPLKARASLVPVATSLLRCGVEAIEDMQHARLEVFGNAKCLRSAEIRNAIVQSILTLALFNHYLQFHKTLKRNADTE